MFIKKYGDIIVGGFFMALSVAMIVLAKMLPKSAVMAIGPDFMPTVIGGVTFVLAAALVVTSLMALKHGIVHTEAVQEESPDYKRVLISFLLILVYVFVFKPVGFILSTCAYLPVQMFVLAPEDRRSIKDILKLAVISVIFTFVVFVLFRYGFKIILPAGLFTIRF
ncbi:hypothetical protein SDC9_122961 [bioreactor metagenome]|uniref:DUF1468 domain-containing protein n=1 Tax=bioreactor metagenome TaxID=1076179 RepID=A0A645CG57_9ZZZZ